MPSGVSPGWITRAVMPSAQAEAETRNASDFVSWSTKSPWPSLSSMSWSAVRGVGHAQQRFGQHHQREALLGRQRYSRSISSTPPSRTLARIASISRVAVRSTLRFLRRGKPRAREQAARDGGVVLRIGRIEAVNDVGSTGMRFPLALVEI